MKSISRRSFLRLAGAALATALCAPLLTACGSAGIGGAATPQFEGTTWHCLHVDTRDSTDPSGNPRVNYTWDYYTITFDDADFCHTRTYHDTSLGKAPTDDMIQNERSVYYSHDGVDWKQEGDAITLMHSEFKIRDDNGTPTLVLGQNMIGMSNDELNVFYPSLEQAKASTGVL